MKTLEVPLREELIQGQSDQELITKLQESLTIRRYLDADLSIGEVAELVSLTVPEAMDWLHEQGIATTRRMDPNVDTILEKNRRLHCQELKSAAPAT